MADALRHSHVSGPVTPLNVGYSRKQLSLPGCNTHFICSLYTGAAVLIAAVEGCEVTHVDSAKGVVNWAKENQRLSGLEYVLFLSLWTMP